MPSFLDSRKKGCVYEEDIKIYWTVNKYYYAYSICGVYSSFNKFQDRLPENFIRCHKSYVANISQIKDVEPVSGTITFKDNSACDIGPKYKSEFMEVLRKYGNFE